MLLNLSTKLIGYLKNSFVRCRRRQGGNLVTMWKEKTRIKLKSENI